MAKFSKGPFVDTSGFRARMIGTTATATANSTTNIDVLFSQEYYINGIEIISSNITMGDKVTLQIVDKDRVYAGVLYDASIPGEVVLDEFGTAWNLAPGVTKSGPYQTNYPARIYAGLYVRVKYTNTSILTNTSVGVNIFRHVKIG